MRGEHRVVAEPAHLTDRWERHYWLLKQFKKKYGHCEVRVNV